MEKQSNNKGLVIILSIVILVLFGTIVYMFVKGNFANNNQSGNVNKTEEQKENNVNSKGESIKQDDETYKEIDLSLDNYSSVYNFVTKDGYTRSGQTVKETFWSTNETTNKTLNNNVKLAISLLVNGTSQFKYDREEKDILGTTISIYSLSGDIVLAQINELFGTDNGYNHVSFSSSRGPDFNKCINLSYNLSSNKYEIFEGSGCGDISSYVSHNKIVKAVKNKDFIIVTEKVYFSSGEGVFKDLKLTNKIADSYNESNSDHYYSNATTITYTFKLEGNNYYFYNSEITY